MNEPARAAVKLAAFLLPAFLLAGTLHLWGPDLRGLVVRITEGGPRTIERTTFTLKAPNRAWARDLTDWTEKAIADLVDRGKPLGFRPSDKSLLIVVVDLPVGENFNEQENSITLNVKNYPEPRKAYGPLSNLLTKALLFHSGPPTAAWSPWLEEGLATYFQTTDKVVGSRKDDLMRQAAERLESLTLQRVLQDSDPRGHGLSGASHSLIAFLELNDAKFQQYFDEERRPGAIATGAFERIFGPDLEREWKESLKPFQKH
ncbi:MAG TPA: hypothetical protein VK661_12175 [Planctomycetota bacterium]|nr:hypothetical protein [Planctomycetota bacterium]